MKSSIVCFVAFILIFTDLKAQDTTLNKYGLWVIKNVKQLRLSTQNVPRKVMEDLSQLLPGVVLDLKYAGTHNFMKQRLYSPVKTTYMRREAAMALQAVQQELNKQGKGLKIWDAYRPYSVTEKMWEPIKDDRYAADPRKGSGHNRGIAVDLTIIHTLNNMELDMGTGFDHFSDTAHHAFKELPAQVLSNRLLLRSLMEKHGFKALETEWWHYYLPNAQQYELLDISFKALGKMKRK